MPAGIKPITCVGKKGRSGRKSFRDEMLRVEVIEKAWEKKKRKMSDNDATQIVVKDMTAKTDVNVAVNIDNILKKIIDRNN